MIMRHSKQMPMPQSGVLGSPATEILAGAPAMSAATAALVPFATSIVLPFT
jgi:hypothetical protein